MSNTPRVPMPNSPREIEDWRIRLAAGIGSSLAQTDVLGTTDGITVTINTDGTITLSISGLNTKEVLRRSYFYGRSY